MFVGVVVENFHKCQERQEKEEKVRREAARMSKLQRKWQREIRHLCLTLVKRWSLLLVD